ncbi:MAG TPA: DUF4412 domain-containing protein [Williamwhitmania sp.]|nr:DUF4412 domain-containing protein [Williamwhitmania sp.]
MNFWITSIISIFTILSAPSRSTPFEGKVGIIQVTPYDTTKINLYVKGNEVRVDMYDTNNDLIRSTLVNLTSREVILLSQKQHAFLIPQSLPPYNATVVINKSQNHKIIEGLNCYQWRVKQSSNRDESAFWVAEIKMDFFAKLLSIYDPTETNLRAFFKIPEHAGFFPMVYEERTFLRAEKVTITVKEIKSAKLEGRLFEIPNSYTQVRS